MRSRAYCFTFNNYTEEDYKSICDFPSRYTVVGKEIGESGTPHLQGYWEFPTQRCFDALKKVFPRLHLEARKGTPLEASSYCKKDNDFFEKGELSAQGKRSDLDQVIEMVREKRPFSEIASTCPSAIIKYSKGIRELHSSFFTHRTEPPTVIWLYGTAGVGKTRYAHDKHGTSNVYIKDSSIWWNGYEQQEAIILDDFSYDNKQSTFRDLCRLLDRYAYQGQTKGGYIHIDSPFIYITCEYPPGHYWSCNELAQIERRLTEVKELKLTSEIVSEVAGNTIAATSDLPAAGL